ncbi:MAG: hypothetical protein ACK4E7_04145 [Permianibacter sp.]
MRKYIVHSISAAMCLLAIFFALKWQQSAKALANAEVRLADLQAKATCRVDQEAMKYLRSPVMKERQASSTPADGSNQVKSNKPTFKETPYVDEERSVDATWQIWSARDYFNAEQRDPVWAQAYESKLSSILYGKRFVGKNISDIECRSSACQFNYHVGDMDQETRFAEVSSVMEAFSGEYEKDATLKSLASSFDKETQTIQFTVVDQNGFDAYRKAKQAELNPGP